MITSIIETSKLPDGRYGVTFDDYSGMEFGSFAELEKWSGVHIAISEEEKKQQLLKEAVVAGDISADKEIKPVKTKSFTETVLGFFGL